MVVTQAGLELRMMLRNGEQLLLTIVIPLLVLGVLAGTKAMDLGDRTERVGFLTPGVLALAVISTSFTGLAIGTGFERRYGALKRLGASPLPRFGLLAGKTLAVLAVETLQVVLICGLALALG
ncbi:MAG: ABC transporter permease, partial [Sporichthyaceae bacterium]